MIFEFVLLVVVVPRSCRLRFWLMRPARWLVPAERCLALPLAVKRNRFLVPLWVFCLGMVGWSRAWREMDAPRGNWQIQ